MATSIKRDPEEFRASLGKEKGVPLAWDEDTDDDEGYAPDSLFKEAIQRDPSLCNNCFNDRYDYVAIEWLCGEQGWQNWSRRYPVPGRNSPDPMREQRHGGEELCCAECGHHTGKDRPVSKRQACAHAARISDALAARGIEHDRKTLLAVTLDRCAIEDTTGVEDAAVFPNAVTEAVRAVQ